MSNEIKNAPDNRDRENDSDVKRTPDEVSGSSDCSFSFEPQEFNRWLESQNNSWPYYTLSKRFDGESDLDAIKRNLKWFTKPIKTGCLLESLTVGSDTQMFLKKQMAQVLTQVIQILESEDGQ